MTLAQNTAELRDNRQSEGRSDTCPRAGQGDIDEQDTRLV